MTERDREAARPAPGHAGDGSELPDIADPGPMERERRQRERSRIVNVRNANDRPRRWGAG